MELQKRVEQLEKQNQSLRRTVHLIVWVVVVVGGFLGYQETIRLFSGNQAFMSREDAEFRLFSTTNGIGRGIHVLSPGADTAVISKDDLAGLYLYELDREGPDEEGHRAIGFGMRAKLEASSEETLLALYDKKLRLRVHLQVTDDGPALLFYDEDGKTVYQVPN